jgi:hypothetical protein
MIDKENTPEEATEKSFEIILDKKFQNNNHYKLFSFIDSIPVDDVVTISDNGVVTPGGNIRGAGLYKGIRPGAYDLSEYRDSEQQIKDAWGDEFVGKIINHNIDDDDDDNNESYYYDLSLNSDPDYKSINGSKNSISIFTGDLVFDVLKLTVRVEGLPPGTFKIALVTFENTPCKDKTKKQPSINATPDKCVPPDIEDYWETIESKELPTSPSGNTFFVEDKNKGGLVFDNEDIKSITPPDGSPGSWELAEWTLTTEDENNTDIEWQFSGATNTFKFDSEEISIGNHVVVLLEKNDTDWVLYESTNGNHIFEYLHILRGQDHSSITMSIP